MQPVLHNTKGAASRILGVIGRTLPSPYNHELLHVMAHVARRYDPGSLPPDSRQHMRHVRGRVQDCGWHHMLMAKANCSSLALWCLGDWCGLHGRQRAKGPTHNCERATWGAL